MKITPNNTSGRLLIALRAGRMTHEQIREAFPDCCAAFTALHFDGLIEKVGGYWQITPEGRNVCPNRRDAKPEPLHTGNTSKSRAHGRSSTRKHNEVHA